MAVTYGKLFWDKYTWLYYLDKVQFLLQLWKMEILNSISLRVHSVKSSIFLGANIFKIIIILPLILL